MSKAMNEKGKSLLVVIIVIALTGLLSACNYQVMDFDYTYDYAIINLGGEYKKYQFLVGKTMKANNYKLKIRMETYI